MQSDVLLNRLEQAIQEVEKLLHFKRKEVESLKEKIQSIHAEKDVLLDKLNYTDTKLAEIQAKLEHIIEGRT